MKALLVALTFLFIIALFLSVAVLAPVLLPPLIEPAVYSGPPAADTVRFHIDIRKSILDWLQTCFGAITAAGLIGTLFYTARNYRIAAETLRVTEHSKFSEAFAKAVELMGNADPGVRVGAIHALGRLALGSKADHSQIMTLLCNEIRRKYPHRLDINGLPITVPPEPAADLQATLDIIAGRNSDWDDKPLDLSGCCLSAVDLQKASLRSANLRDSDLRGSRLQGADLRNANLSDALLSEAIADNANLRRAILRNANLDAAHMTRADLRRADLRGASGTVTAQGARRSHFWGFWRRSQIHWI